MSILKVPVTTTCTLYSHTSWSNSCTASINFCLSFSKFSFCWISNCLSSSNWSFSCHSLLSLCSSIIAVGIPSALPEIYITVPELTSPSWSRWSSSKFKDFWIRIVSMNITTLHNAYIYVPVITFPPAVQWYFDSLTIYVPVFLFQIHCPWYHHLDM